LSAFSLAIYGNENGFSFLFFSFLPSSTNFSVLLKSAATHLFLSFLELVV
jgi:hypothetical protein